MISCRADLFKKFQPKPIGIFGFEVDIDNSVYPAIYYISGRHHVPIFKNTNGWDFENQVFDLLVKQGFKEVPDITYNGQLRKQIEGGLRIDNGALRQWVHGFMDGLKLYFEQEGFKVNLTYGKDAMWFEVSK